jgi:hypothetical protein
MTNKDFDASDLQKIGEGGIKIPDPDQAGPVHPHQKRQNR